MKIGKFLTIILLSVVVLSSCKKDESPANYLSYDGKQYTIDKGALENWGPTGTDGAYNIDLTLLSSGLNIIEVNNEFDDISGNGHFIWLEIYTSSSTELINGTYNYDYFAEESFTFDDGTVFINLNTTDETGDLYYIEDGSVTVNRSGDVYEITFDLEDEDGKSVKGHYKGTLQYYDYEEPLKSTKKEKRRH